MSTYTPITKVQINTFVFTDDFGDDLLICATCATRSPELNPRPTNFTYDIFTDAFVSLCYSCDLPIIAINEEAD